MWYNHALIAASNKCAANLERYQYNDESKEKEVHIYSRKCSNHVLSRTHHP
jgi:hypothetical protein